MALLNPQVYDIFLIVITIYYTGNDGDHYGDGIVVNGRPLVASSQDTRSSVSGLEEVDALVVDEEVVDATAEAARVPQMPLGQS